MERQLGLNFLVSLIILFSLAGSSQARNIKVSVPAQSVSHVGSTLRRIEDIIVMRESM